MKNKHHMLVIASAALLTAHAATAQGYNYTKPTGTAYNSSAYVLPTISGINPDDQFGKAKNLTGGGIRFGAPVSPQWDIQLGLQYGRVSDAANRYEQMSLGLDGVYLFSRSRFRPLILVGVGAEKDKFTTPLSTANSTSPYIGAGFGFQFSFNDQWGMQADLRRNRAYLRGNDFAFKNANTDVFSIGLMYTFEKVAQPTPRVAQVPVYVAPPEPAPVVAMPVPVPVPAPAPLPPPVVLAAPPTPVPMPMPTPPKFERMTISASKLFNFDSAELRTPMPRLDEAVEALTKFPDANNIVITGYTDRLGTDAYNQTLSQKRADAVKNYMMNRGVASNRMTATGKGESNPVVYCKEKSMAKLITCLEPNRRVELEQVTLERRVQ